MIDIPIGKALEVVSTGNSISCDGCIFLPTDRKCSQRELYCNGWFRRDGLNVIFKLVDLPNRDNIKSCYELSQGRENNENDKSKN
jgi:hypothetical protein